MSNHKYNIRNAKPDEFEQLGKLMVEVYSGLEGFPKEKEQPAYYEMLLNIGEFTNQPGTELRRISVVSRGYRNEGSGYWKIADQRMHPQGKRKRYVPGNYS